MDFKTTYEKIKNEPEQHRNFSQFCEGKQQPLSVLLWHFINNDKNLQLGKCENCGKTCKFIVFKYGYHRFCSTTCSNQFNTSKRIKTIQERYGVRGALQHPDIMAKRKRNSLEKYGVDNFAKSEEYKKVLKENNLKKYGKEHHNQVKENKDKILKAWLVNWGKKNPALHPMIQSKIKKTLMDRYGVDHPRYTHLNPELVEVMHSRIWWEQIFLQDGMTIKEIMDETGLSRDFINMKLREYGLRDKDQSGKYSPSQSNDLFGIF